MSFACGVLLDVDRQAARQLLKVVAWSVVVYAVFAIVSYLTVPTRTLFCYETQIGRV